MIKDSLQGDSLDEQMAGYVCDPGELMSPSPPYLGGSQATAGGPDVDTGDSS